MLCFILTVLACRAMNEFDSVSLKTVAGTGGILALLCVILQKYADPDNEYLAPNDYTCIWFTLILIAVWLAVLGLFSGIFVGGWILALAEIVNIFPILTRRIGLTKGLSLVVIAIALGKMSGSLIYFYFRW